jgi:hemolysin-activating ACP:hemolysin acyltransferase
MWGKRRQEVQPENSRDADVQKFFASMGAVRAQEAPPQAAAKAAQPMLETQPLPVPARHENGPAAQPTPDAENAAPVGEQAPRRVRANPVSTAFGDMVALLAKSPAHKHFSLADLEWLLLPPVALNQFALADAKLPNGQTVLAGLVLWAHVAPDVDARLAQSERYPVRLHPNEWRSGDILWIVDAVGNPKMIQTIIGGLAENAFGGKQFKMLRHRIEAAVPAQPERSDSRLQTCYTPDVISSR